MNGRVAKVSEFLKEYDLQLYEHCLRTAIRAKSLAELLNVNLELVYQAALIHDVGKMGVSNTIFNKTSALSDNERKAVDLHSFIGYSLAYNMGVPKDICILILYHHGYQKERFGEYSFIPEEFKLLIDIIRISDIYDALTSDRVYRKKMSHGKAINSLYDDFEFDGKLISKFDVLCTMKIS